MGKLTTYLIFVFLICSLLLPLINAQSNQSFIENTWITKAQIHEARSGLGLVEVAGKLYAIGGSASNGMVTNKTGGLLGTNEEYNPLTDEWIFKKSMPTPREYFAIASYGNKIYCIGGNTDNGLTGINEVYDVISDSWENRAPLPIPRLGLQANIVNGKIYLIGGYVPNAPGIASYSNRNDVYDPTTDTWYNEEPIPTAVSGRLSAVIDNRIYILMPNPNLNQIYDIQTRTWSLGQPLPGFPAYGTVIATSGKNAPPQLYVIGDSKTEIYNPINQTWKLGSPIPTKREGFSLANINDQLYAVGGYTVTYTNLPNDLLSGGNITKQATNELYIPVGYITPSPTIPTTPPNQDSLPVFSPMVVIIAILSIVGLSFLLLLRHVLSKR